MRILLTNVSLASHSGTEIVTRDLALELARVGHEPCVYTPRPGAVACEITASGVPVVSRLEDVPFRPDVIHGHHHVETVLALLHFRSVPAIYVCHDRLIWLDTPPRLSAVRRYVAVDRNCLERLIVESGIPVERTSVIPNAVDLRRFKRREGLPPRPARALVFSNNAREGAELEILRRACADAGIELNCVGAGVGAQVSRPEEILGEYDLVFAKARCALESLATGCAVILYDWQGLGPMVTSGQVQELRSWNFGMRCLQRKLTPAGVRRELAFYDPDDAARVTDILRAEASLERAVADYVKLYEEALGEPGAVCVSFGEVAESLVRNVGSLEGLLRSAGEPLGMPPLPVPATTGIGLRLSRGIRRMTAGCSAQVAVEIENSSAELLASLPPYPVHLSYHWLNAKNGRYLVFEGERTVLTAPVRPRSRHAQEVRVLAPQEPGEYVLALTLVQEHRFWFDQVPQPVMLQWPVVVDNGKQPGKWTLREVAAWVSARLVREGEFANMGFLSAPQDRMLVFVEDRRFAARAASCAQASCILTTPELAGLFPERFALAVADEPKRCFFEIHNRLATETDFYGEDFPSRIHAGARLHPRSWVDEKNVIIGDG